jgi:hypothetical protein
MFQLYDHLQEKVNRIKCVFALVENCLKIGDFTCFKHVRLFIYAVTFIIFKLTPLFMPPVQDIRISYAFL